MSLPPLTSSEAAQQLEEKIQEIEIQKKEELVQKQAQKLGIPYINLFGFAISPEVLTIIPKEKASALKTVCFLFTGTGGEIRLASLNPLEPPVQALFKSLEQKYQAHGVLYLISPYSFNFAFKLYATLPTIKKIKRGVEITEDDLNKYKNILAGLTLIGPTLPQSSLAQLLAPISVTEKVVMILASALNSRASDIHLETESEELKIRFRIDGELYTVASLNKETARGIIDRLKLLSGLKINVGDKPQDGHFSIFLTDDKIDLRVSTLPSQYGESLVLRILMAKAALISFEELGLKGEAQKRLKREIERPNGMIITTGPTGSGKTTTLYAILNKLNQPGVKIITIEDPIEYELKGIIQSQVDNTTGYTFAKGLKSMMRQDPDMIMVGEIRDLETTEVAINAALTGHLVLSTLHTNSAAASIPRFLSLGAKPFLLAPSLNALIGQRLVRKICSSCKEKIDLDQETLIRVKEILKKLSLKTKIDEDHLSFFKGKGCPQCQGIGFQGRIGIFEIMTIVPEIEKLILAGSASEYALQEIAVKNGMMTMVEDGLLKALDGITTVEEVFGVAE